MFQWFSLESPKQLATMLSWLSPINMVKGYWFTEITEIPKSIFRTRLKTLIIPVRKPLKALVDHTLRFSIFHGVYQKTLASINRSHLELFFIQIQKTSTTILRPLPETFNIPQCRCEKHWQVFLDHVSRVLVYYCHVFLPLSLSFPFGE